MFRLFTNPEDASATSQIKFYRRLGGGRAVSAYVPRGEPGPVMIQFEHQITERNVLSPGMLAPLAVTMTKRRGAKRSVSVIASHEAAQALHAALGDALKVVRRRRRAREFMSIAIAMMYQTFKAKTAVYPINGGVSYGRDDEKKAG